MPWTLTSKTCSNIVHIFNFIRKKNHVLSDIYVWKLSITCLFPLHTSHFLLIFFNSILLQCPDSLISLHWIRLFISFIFSKKVLGDVEPCLKLPCHWIACIPVAGSYLPADYLYSFRWGPRYKLDAHILSFWIFDLLIAHNEISLSKQNLSTWTHEKLFDLKHTWLAVMIANDQAKILLVNM